MRSHADILNANGCHAIAQVIEPHVEGDLVTVQKRVRGWAVTGSIPGEYWALLDRLGFASIDELAFDAARRKGISTPSEQAAA